MPSWSKVLGDRSRRRQKTLGMAGRFEPLHAPLPLARRPMRWLTSIIEVATLAMFHTWQQLAFGGTVALQLIRDDDAWHKPQALEQLAEELLRRFFVPTTLHQDIEHMAVLIDGPPQIIALTIDRQKHLIQMPLVARLRPSTPQPIGIVLPELQTPLADGFIGDVDAACKQQ